MNPGNTLGGAPDRNNPDAKQHLLDTIPGQGPVITRIFDAVGAEGPVSKLEEPKSSSERIQETLQRMSEAAGVDSSYTHVVGRGFTIGFGDNSVEIREDVMGIGVGDMNTGTIRRSISRTDAEQPWVQQLLSEAGFSHVRIIDDKPPQ